MKVVVIGPSGLHTLVCDIDREDLREQLAEVEASDLDDEEKSRRGANVILGLLLGPLRGGLLLVSQCLTMRGAPRVIRAHLRPSSRTGSLFLIMLLGIVVFSIVSPGLCRSALRGWSPLDGMSFEVSVVSQGDLLLDLMGWGTRLGRLVVRSLLMLCMTATG